MGKARFCLRACVRIHDKLLPKSLSSPSEINFCANLPNFPWTETLRLFRGGFFRSARAPSALKSPRLLKHPLPSLPALGKSTAEASGEYLRHQAPCTLLARSPAPPPENCSAPGSFCWRDTSNPHPAPADAVPDTSIELFHRWQ